MTEKIDAEIKELEDKLKPLKYKQRKELEDSEKQEAKALVGKYFIRADCDDDGDPIGVSDFYKITSSNANMVDYISVSQSVTQFKIYRNNDFFSMINGEFEEVTCKEFEACLESIIVNLRLLLEQGKVLE